MKRGERGEGGKDTYSKERIVRHLRANLSHRRVSARAHTGRVTFLCHLLFSRFLVLTSQLAMICTAISLRGTWVTRDPAQTQFKQRKVLIK